MRLATLTVFVVAGFLASPAFAQDATRADFQEFAKTIAGRWIGEVTWVADWPGFGKKGDTVTCYWEGKLTEDGNVVVGKFFGGDGTETSMIYYDAGAKRIRSTMASSPGAVTHAIVCKKDGKWRQEGKGSLADGTKTQYSSIAIISDGGNKWIWEGTGTVGNEATDNQRDVWRRVSK